MSRFRFKKREQVEESFSINVIPMIDLVTILNAFLLVSASFFAFGQIRVEIPFLSSAMPPKGPQKESFTLNVEILKKGLNIQLQSSVNPRKDKRISIPKKSSNQYDFERFHREVADIKRAHPDVDLMTVFPGDRIEYQTIILLLDAARELKPGDPKLVTKLPDGTELPAHYLISKVVMGGVIL